ncbi:MAG: hypothetical protein HY321_20795 [Armatimonadetes bacterium]|nr:hypothetical protein [Armatimonadota bacterium]
MSVITLEGVVEHGQIRLADNIQLPDQTRVYVIVPDAQIEQTARIVSPRLAHPEQAGDFQMQVMEGPDDAGV